MRAEEIEHRTVSRGLCDRGTQAFRRQAGEREKALRPIRIRENPAKRAKGNPRGVFNRMFNGVKNCQGSGKEIVKAAIFRGGGRVGG